MTEAIINGVKVIFIDTLDENHPHQQQMKIIRDGRKRFLEEQERVGEGAKSSIYRQPFDIEKLPVSELYEQSLIS